MKVKALFDTTGTARDVSWGNGQSRRLLVEADGLPYSLTDTIVRAGTRSLLRYDHHHESCYCIEGDGYIEWGGGQRADLVPGVLYSPDLGEAHALVAVSDVRLICVFSPPLVGDERHRLVPGEASTYRHPRARDDGDEVDDQAVLHD